MARTPIVTATYKTFPIKKILLIMFALLPTVAIAADKSITVSFDYSGNASAYRLYMDGNQVCESQAGAEKTMQCASLSIPYGVHLFTMTAIDGGVETNHSQAYAWTYSPANAAPPTMINFTITVDGQAQQVGPVPIK